MSNDVYAKDISRKIITSFRARQEKGEILPAFAPYGYVKSKTVQYRYEVDMETAPYVKQIFEWRAEGINRTEICRRLNKTGAVTPAMRKVQLGIWKAEKYKHTVWDGATVAGIMKNPTYTGCIVYGRTPRSLCDGIKAHRADPKEWRYVPNTHEPIISQELFDRVQAILAEETKRWAAAKEESYEVRKNIVNVFQGRIWCGDCGKRMRFIKPTDKRYPRDEDHARFVCGGYMDSDKRSCSRHSIRYPDVKKAAAEVIRTQMEYALSQEKLMRKMRGSTKEKNLLDSYAAKVSFLQQEQARIDARRAGLFEKRV